MSLDDMYIYVPDSCAASSAAWKRRSAAENPLHDLQCWASFSALCLSHVDIILLSISLSHNFLGLRPFAVGIPESIFGFRHSHFHFHCIGTSFADHMLQSAVKMVFWTPSVTVVLKRFSILLF